MWFLQNLVKKVGDFFTPDKEEVIAPINQQAAQAAQLAQSAASTITWPEQTRVSTDYWFDVNVPSVTVQQPAPLAPTVDFKIWDNISELSAPIDFTDKNKLINLWAELAWDDARDISDSEINAFRVERWLVSSPYDAVNAPLNLLWTSIWEVNESIQANIKEAEWKPWIWNQAISLIWWLYNTILWTGIDNAQNSSIAAYASTNEEIRNSAERNARDNFLADQMEKSWDKIWADKLRAEIVSRDDYFSAAKDIDTALSYASFLTYWAAWYAKWASILWKTAQTLPRSLAWFWWLAWWMDQIFWQVASNFESLWEWAQEFNLIGRDNQWDPRSRAEYVKTDLWESKTVTEDDSILNTTSPIFWIDSKLSKRIDMNEFYASDERTNNKETINNLYSNAEYLTNVIKQWVDKHLVDLKWLVSEEVYNKEKASAYKTIDSVNEFASYVLEWLSKGKTKEEAFAYARGLVDEEVALTKTYMDISSKVQMLWWDFLARWWARLTRFNYAVSSGIDTWFEKFAQWEDFWSIKYALQRETALSAAVESLIVERLSDKIPLGKWAGREIIKDMSMSTVRRAFNEIADIGKAFVKEWVQEVIVNPFYAALDSINDTGIKSIWDRIESVVLDFLWWGIIWSINWLSVAQQQEAAKLIKWEIKDEDSVLQVQLTKAYTDNFIDQAVFENIADEIKTNNFKIINPDGQKIIAEWGKIDSLKAEHLDIEAIKQAKLEISKAPFFTDPAWNSISLEEYNKREYTRLKELSAQYEIDIKAQGLTTEQIEQIEIKYSKDKENVPAWARSYATFMTQSPWGTYTFQDRLNISDNDSDDDIKQRIKAIFPNSVNTVTSYFYNEEWWRRDNFNDMIKEVIPHSKEYASQLKVREWMADAFKASILKTTKDSKKGVWFYVGWFGRSDFFNLQSTWSNVVLEWWEKLPQFRFKLKNDLSKPDWLIKINDKEYNYVVSERRISQEWKDIWLNDEKVWVSTVGWSDVFTLYVYEWDWSNLVVKESRDWYFYPYWSTDGKEFFSVRFSSRDGFENSVIIKWEWLNKDDNITIRSNDWSILFAKSMEEQIPDWEDIELNLDTNVYRNIVDAVKDSNNENLNKITEQTLSKLWTAIDKISTKTEDKWLMFMSLLTDLAVNYIDLNQLNSTNQFKNIDEAYFVYASAMLLRDTKHIDKVLSLMSEENKRAYAKFALLPYEKKILQPQYNDYMKEFFQSIWMKYNKNTSRFFLKRLYSLGNINLLRELYLTQDVASKYKAFNDKLLNYDKYRLLWKVEQAKFINILLGVQSFYKQMTISINSWVSFARSFTDILKANWISISTESLYNRVKTLVNPDNLKLWELSEDVIVDLLNQYDWESVRAFNKDWKMFFNIMALSSSVISKSLKEIPNITTDLMEEIAHMVKKSYDSSDFTEDLKWYQWSWTYVDMTMAQWKNVIKDNKAFWREELLASFYANYQYRDKEYVNKFLEKFAYVKTSWDWWIIEYLTVKAWSSNDITLENQILDFIRNNVNAHRFNEYLYSHKIFDNEGNKIDIADYKKEIKKYYDHISDPNWSYEKSSAKQVSELFWKKSDKAKNLINWIVNEESANPFDSDALMLMISSAVDVIPNDKWTLALRLLSKLQWINQNNIQPILNHIVYWTKLPNYDKSIMEQVVNYLAIYKQNNNFLYDTPKTIEWILKWSTVIFNPADQNYIIWRAETDSWYEYRVKLNFEWRILKEWEVMPDWVPYLSNDIDSNNWDINRPPYKTLWKFEKNNVWSYDAYLYSSDPEILKWYWDVVEINWDKDYYDKVNKSQEKYGEIINPWDYLDQQRLIYSDNWTLSNSRLKFMYSTKEVFNIEVPSIAKTAKYWEDYTIDLVSSLRVKWIPTVWDKEYKALAALNFDNKEIKNLYWWTILAKNWTTLVSNYLSLLREVWVWIPDKWFANNIEDSVYRFIEKNAWAWFSNRNVIIWFINSVRDWGWFENINAKIKQAEEDMVHYEQEWEVRDQRIIEIWEAFWSLPNKNNLLNTSIIRSNLETWTPSKLTQWILISKLDSIYKISDQDIVLRYDAIESIIWQIVTNPRTARSIITQARQTYIEDLSKLSKVPVSTIQDLFSELEEQRKIRATVYTIRKNQEWEDIDPDWLTIIWSPLSTNIKESTISTSYNRALRGLYMVKEILDNQVADKSKVGNMVSLKNFSDVLTKWEYSVVQHIDSPIDQLMAWVELEASKKDLLSKLDKFSPSQRYKIIEWLKTIKWFRNMWMNNYKIFIDKYFNNLWSKIETTLDTMIQALDSWKIERVWMRRLIFTQNELIESWVKYVEWVNFVGYSRKNNDWEYPTKVTYVWKDGKKRSKELMRYVKIWDRYQYSPRWEYVLWYSGKAWSWNTLLTMRDINESQLWKQWDADFQMIKLSTPVYKANKYNIAVPVLETVGGNELWSWLYSEMMNVIKKYSFKKRLWSIWLYWNKWFEPQDDLLTVNWEISDPVFLESLYYKLSSFIQDVKEKTNVDEYRYLKKYVNVNNESQSIRNLTAYYKWLSVDTDIKPKELEEQSKEKAIKAYKAIVDWSIQEDVASSLYNINIFYSALKQKLNIISDDWLVINLKDIQNTKSQREKQVELTNRILKAKKYDEKYGTEQYKYIVEEFEDNVNTIISQWKDSVNSLYDDEYKTSAYKTLMDKTQRWDFYLATDMPVLLDLLRDMIDYKPNVKVNPFQSNIWFYDDWSDVATNVNDPRTLTEAQLILKQLINTVWSKYDYIPATKDQLDKLNDLGIQEAKHITRKRKEADKIEAEKDREDRQKRGVQDDPIYKAPRLPEFEFVPLSKQNKKSTINKLNDYTNSLLIDSCDV